MSNDIPAVFHTSMFGRFAHALFALIFGAFTVAGVWVFLSGRGLGGGLLLSIAAIAAEIGAGWLAIYCLGFALKRGDRFICTNEQLVYRGLTRTFSIPWSNVNEMWLDFGGRSPFVYMVLRTRPLRWRPYWLNLSGITPDYPVLVSLVRAHLPHAKVWQPPLYDQVMQPESNVPLALRETLVDSTLTVVRTDAPQAARSSTLR